MKFEQLEQRKLTASITIEGFWMQGWANRDWDGDGIADLYLSNGGVRPGIYSLATGRAEAINEIVSSRGNPVDVIGDLDGDGIEDPFSRNPDWTFNVELSKMADQAFAASDFNEDGATDFADFLNLSANFGNEGDKSMGDATGDGMIDFADFLVLSSEFGVQP